MKNYFYNITGGEPKSLYPSSFASILDGLCKIVPAAAMLEIFNVLFQSFEHPESGLDIRRLWMITIFSLLWLVVTYFTYSNSYNKTYVAAYTVSASGRLKLADHIRKLSLGFYGQRDPGDITNLLLSDYAQVETTISHNVPQLISAIVLPIVAFVGLLFINWKMALAMFIALPFSILLLWLTNSIQEKLSVNQVIAKNNAASRLQEYLGGIRDIKAYNIGGERFERLRFSFDELKKTSIQLEGIMGPLVMGALLLARSGMTIMIYVGSYLLLDGEMNLPMFLLFILVGIRVFDPLTVVLTNYGEIRYSAYSAKRIMEVQEEPVLTGTEDIDGRQEIVFDQVTFGYDETIPVLKKLSLQIQPKSITALVGPSGCGKSTVTRLLARFWDIQGGKITIGGKNIKEVDPEKLLQNISMVFQDVYLFQDTIGNNIRIGNMNATQEEIEEAAKRACCHEFISNLPQGYNTPVGEGGSTLSGGEKQRISIARALLKNASIVLLDEATASLDPENETAVQNAINELVSDKTVIIIAHRLKTIQNADKIVVLKDGRLVEEGQHTELLEKGGLYADLWNIQQGIEDWQVKQ